MGKKTMKQKKIWSAAFAIFLLVTCAFAAVPAIAENGTFHAVKGALYINGIAAPAGIQVFLVFPSENLSRPTFDWDQGYNYAISFEGHEGQTGSFFIDFQGQYYTPTDNPTVIIIHDVIGYHINLHITVSGGENIPPVADAGGPYVAQVNTPITFIGADSYDLDGSILGYRWDWMNDGTYDTTWLPDPTASYTYTTADNYIVKLQVKDDDGAINNDTASVTITTTPPTNQPPRTPAAPDPLDFSINQSIFTDLGWDGGDPDNTDTMFYDIYLGTTNPPVNYDATSGYPATQTQITFSLPQLLFGTQYYWQIVAHDNHGASTTGPIWRFKTIPAGADTQPPSKVTGLIVTDAKDGKLNLAWNASTDNVAVDHYKIYRDSIFLINWTTTSFLDTGLTNGQTYIYQVSAVDTSGNEGLKSDPVSASPTASGGVGGDGGGISNILPVADLSAGEPYRGIVGENILFDGSKSHDLDGKIVSWYWTFGDGANSTEKNITHHVYAHAGVFNVTLTVTDNQGAQNTKITTATITVPNLPPTQPILTGPTTGNMNTSYTYSATSTDPEGSNLTYAFDWGDHTSKMTDALPNGTSAVVNHTWTSAGVYHVTVVVKDDQLALSNPTSLTMLIDVEYTGTIGYLIDHSGDGTYDAFYSNQTKKETGVEKQVNGTYFIDSTGDGKWDYIYDPHTKTLMPYPNKEGTPQGDMALQVLGGILGIIAVLFIILLLLVRRKKNKVEESSTKTTGEKQTTKKTGAKPKK